MSTGNASDRSQLPTSDARPDSAGTRLNRKRFIDWLLGTTLGGLLLATLYPVAR